jgi:predicted NAD/FAD-binding protein
MRVAIIGGGISGCTAALRLKDRFDCTLFEQNDYLGGHTNTIDLSWHGQSYQIDTGFIVFNEKTYPRFIGLLTELEVNYESTNMSFSVRCDAAKIEYAGSNFSTLFSDRGNLLNPRFLKMITDIIRFNRLSTKRNFNNDQVLLEFLKDHKFNDHFINYYLLPMCASIWSTDINEIGQTPIGFLMSFFNNHGLTQITKRPQWHVISGGSNQYIEALKKKLYARVLLGHKVRRVARSKDGITIKCTNDYEAQFDRVIFACHSDQALSLIDQPTPQEYRLLSSVRYQYNQAILHLDTRLLPKKKRAWSAWNYLITPDSICSPLVTYNMKILQNLANDAPHFCVSLNAKDLINPALILKEIDYTHPIIDQNACMAQDNYNQINGKNNTFFCGAYWGNGFHEDGVVSGECVSEKLIEEIDGKQLSL